MLKIAILIPCFNAANYLPELFEAVKLQTIPFDEILCYDDCSSDNTIEIAEQYGIKIIKGKENKGAAFARNRLIEATSCNWIHFHDADDLIDCRFVEIMKKNIINENIQFLCNTYVLDRNHRSTSLGNIIYNDLSFSKDKLAYFIRNVGFASMGLYSKSALKKIGGFNETLRGNEDPDLHIRLVHSGFDINCIQEFLVTKLEHENSFSHQNWFRCLSDKFICLENYSQILDKKYHVLLGEQAAALSNYFYRQGDTALSNKAREFSVRMHVKNLNTSLYANLISSIFGIRVYLWTYRIRADLTNMIKKA